MQLTLTRARARSLSVWSTLAPFLRRRAGTRSTWIVAIALAALVVRLPGLVADAIPVPDTATYLAFPGPAVTPGYPAYLWLVELLPGPTVDAAVVVQHLLGIGLAVSALLVGWRLFDPPTGVIAGTVAALSPSGVTLENLLTPDFLFAVLAFSGAVTLVLAAVSEAQTWRLLALAGTFFALATYMKPVGQALILAAPLTLWAGVTSRRAYARASLIVMASMLIVLSPWLIRNAIVYEELGMSNQLGLTLFNRAFEVDRFEVPATSADGRLVKRLTVEAPLKGQRPNIYVLRELSRQGRDPDEAVTLMRSAALEAILAAPLTYAKSSVRRLGLAVADFREVPGETTGNVHYDELRARLEKAPPMLRGVSARVLAVGRRLTQLWIVMTANVAAGLLLLLTSGRRRIAVASFLSVTLLVVLTTVLTHGGLWRYSMQLSPEMWLVGSGGLVYVVVAVATRLRAERENRPSETR